MQFCNQLRALPWPQAQCISCIVILTHVMHSAQSRVFEERLPTSMHKDGLVKQSGWLGGMKAKRPDKFLQETCAVAMDTTNHTVFAGEGRTKNGMSKTHLQVQRGTDFVVSSEVTMSCPACTLGRMQSSTERWVEWHVKEWNCPLP